MCPACAGTPSTEPRAAICTTRGAGAVGWCVELSDFVAGFGLDSVDLGRASRHGNALNSLDSADLNALAGCASVSHCPRNKPAEECGGDSQKARTYGPRHTTAVHGDAAQGAAGAEAKRAVPRPGANNGEPAAVRVVPCPGPTDGKPVADVANDMELMLRSAPADGDTDTGRSHEASRVREVRPNVEIGTLQRRPMDFHAIPIFCVTTVPELGLHGLIRSKLASIRTSGAHVFRVVSPEVRPVPSRAPQRLVGEKVSVRIQSFPQLPTIVSDTFHGSRAMDPSVKGRQLRSQLPSEGEKWMSVRDLSAKIDESTNAMLSQYKDLTVLNFLRSVNDASVTWVRKVTAAGHEKAIMGPGKPHTADVYYESDLSPENEDGCSRSLGDPACKATVGTSFPTDRLQNPRTLNHHSMLGAGSTCEGVNTNLLYMGTMGSFFSWHVEDSLLLSVSYLQTGASKYWFFVPRSELPLMVRVLEENMDPDVLKAAGGDVWAVLAKKAVLWPATFFLSHGIRVGFHAMEVGDYVVTGYGVPVSGFNGGKNVASAVNLACTVWLSYAIEHAAQWRGKLAILIPFEKLLVLAAMKLVDGEWWVGDA